MLLCVTEFTVNGSKSYNEACSICICN